VQVDLLLVRQDGVSVFLDFVVVVIVFVQEDEGLVLLQVCLRDKEVF
jgi:hypothetical protein